MAVSIVFQFPGGRYHATPWGHHVNEGLVEWPPCPWRVVRALISVAFTKVNASDPLPENHVLRSLVLQLSSSLPEYIIPKSVSGTHTRHYMPQYGIDGNGRQKTSLVLDASALPGEQSLAITWHIDLNKEHLDYLGLLVDSLSYLGRAESWVDARVLSAGETLPVGEKIQPCKDQEGARLGFEQTALLAPVPWSEYSAWRNMTVAPVLEQYPLPATGKKVPAKLKKLREKAEAPYPLDLFDCLTKETSWMQKYGWAQPAGSRRVLYWIPNRAISTSRPNPKARSAIKDRPHAVLLALASDTARQEVLPLFSRCVPQAELLHRALVARLGRGEQVDCPSITGKDAEGRPAEGHRHLHIIPLSLDEPGHLDHFLLWAPDGLDSKARDAVFGLKYVWTKGDESPLHVSVAGSGDLGDFVKLLRDCSSSGSVLGKAETWTSLTPFVPPRHLKARRHTLEDQVIAELKSRGLPSDVRLQVMDKEVWAERRFHRFVKVRTRPAPAPPMNIGLALTLHFNQPVEGPLCLGYGSHFGLGLFKSVESND